MGKFKIHGVPYSTCTKRTLTTCAELGLDYELVIVDLMKGAHKSEEFLKLQPFGQIPVLEDGEFKLFESRAICRYLADSKPGNTLYPSDPKLRALVEQWISVEMSNFDCASSIVFELMFKKMLNAGETDLMRVATQKVRLLAFLDVVEKYLKTKEGPYLVGKEFTLADLVFLPYTELLLTCEDGFYKKEYEARPSLLKWWQAISSRPSWMKVSPPPKQ